MTMNIIQEKKMENLWEIKTKKILRHNVNETTQNQKKLRSWDRLLYNKPDMGWPPDKDSCFLAHHPWVNDSSIAETLSAIP